MTASEASVDLGVLVDGEIPEPIEYQFLDGSGDAIDLTGYTASLSLKIGQEAAVTLPATVSAPEEGKVTHTWLEGELVRSGPYGRIRAEFIVSNGTNRFVGVKMFGFLRQAIYYAESS